MGVDLLCGIVCWEVSVVNLCGINEVECLVDLIVLLVCNGEVLCVCVF